MKKILSILSAGILALVAVSCVEEQLAVFDASKAAAPVINEYQMTDDGLTVSFTPGSANQGFNTEMGLNHWLVLTSLDGSSLNKSLASTVKGNVISISTTNLSKALIDMGYPEGTTVSLEMVIRASMQEQARDNGRNGYIDSDGKISIPAYEVYLPTGDPYGRYTEKSPWSLIGSFNGWADDYEMWTNGTLHVAKAVQLAAGDEVKFRKDADWAVNFGYADGVTAYTLGEDFSVGQDGANIVIAEDGLYDFILDEASATARIIASVAQQEDPYAAYKDVSPWSVIGSFNSWGGDVEMVTNGTLHVAKNVTLAAGDEFKFRKDADWAVNFGYADGVSTYTLGEEFSVGQDGANIVIAEDGAYDLFLDPENATAKIIKTQAVTIDPYAAYKDVSPWSVIGSFNSWGGDVEMVTNGTLHVAKAVAFNAGTEWKFRKDADWAVNFGYAEGVSGYTLGEEFAVGQDGANIVIAEDGVYDLILDPENATAKIIASVATEQPEPPAPVDKPKMWSLIGTLDGSSWDKDFDMTNTSGDIWTIKNVTVTASDEFKIRADHDWGKSVGGPEENSTSTIDETNPYGVYKPVLGEAFEAKDKNIQIGVDGQFNVTFDYAANTILVEEYKEFPEHLYMIGAEFGSWDWNSDGVVEMTPVLHNPAWGAEAEGQFYTIRYFTAGEGFKFCAQRAWNGDFWGLETNEGFTEAGGNCTVSESGFYLVHIDMKKSIVHVEPAKVYGIGEAFGGWDEAKEENLFKADGKTLKAKTVAAGKLRMYVTSEIATSGWWTREFNILEGKIVPRLMDELDAPSVKADQEIVLDFNAGTGEIKGEGTEPEPSGFGDYIYAIGGDTGWSNVYPLRSSQEGGVNTGKYKGFGYLSQEFKFKPNEADWNGDWENDGEGKIADNGGANCPAPETAGYYMIEVDLTAMTYTLTPISTIGIIGPAQDGGWDTDTDMAYNAETGAWEATVALKGDKMKFRANDGWDINWGGSFDALTQGGADIAVEEGTYEIKLYAWCDGKAYATVTKQ